VKPSNARTKSAAVRLRLEPELKEQATRVLAGSGLELSIAIRLFLRQVVAQNGLPFELRPNAAALRAMEGAKSLKPRFSSAQELFDALEKGAQRKRRKASPKKRLHKRVSKGLARPST